MISELESEEGTDCIDYNSDNKTSLSVFPVKVDFSTMNLNNWYCVKPEEIKFVENTLDILPCNA